MLLNTLKFSKAGCPLRERRSNTTSTFVAFLFLVTKTFHISRKRSFFCDGHLFQLFSIVFVSLSSLASKERCKAGESGKKPPARSSKNSNCPFSLFLSLLFLFLSLSFSTVTHSAVRQRSTTVYPVIHWRGRSILLVCSFSLSLFL